MAVSRNSEVVERDGVTYTVTEMGALDKMRCFAGLGKDPNPLQQVEAIALALSKCVYIGGDKAFADMEEAGAVTLDTFNALSEAFTRVHEGEDPNA